MTVDMLWRIALLSAVFLADAVVFIRLCREELRDQRLRPGARGTQPAVRKLASVMPRTRLSGKRWHAMIRSI